jgi:hypothetical protein
VGEQCRTGPTIVGVLAEQVPAHHGELDNVAKRAAARAGLTGPDRRGTHSDNVVRYLDALDERADDVALRGPVHRFQPVPHHPREQIELADDHLEGAGLFPGGVQRAGFGFEARHAPAQLGDARFELGFFDQPFGEAVNEPPDRAASLGQPAAEGVELKPTWAGLHRIQAPLVFIQHARGVLQQPADLGPHGLVERLDRHQPGVASALAVIPAAVGAAAPVVAPLPAVMVAGEPVVALAADEQAAQQVAQACESLAVTLPVLFQSRTAPRR